MLEHRHQAISVILVVAAVIGFIAPAASTHAAPVRNAAEGRPNYSFETQNDGILRQSPALPRMTVLPSPSKQEALATEQPGKLQPQERRQRIRLADNCGAPEITVQPMRAGLSSIAIASPCRAYTVVTFNYAGWSVTRFLDGTGKAKLDLDCFAGDGTPIQILFQDGVSVSRRIITRDLKKISKVAIIWRSEVNIDLHAFEFGAVIGGPGHVWHGAPSEFTGAKAAARFNGIGKGFMTTISNGDEQGDKLEVYTFWHGRQKLSRVVKMVADFKTRGAQPSGDYCGKGRLAEVKFQTVLTVRNKEVVRSNGAFASAPCNGLLGEDARYNSKTVPDLVVSNE